MSESAARRMLSSPPNDDLVAALRQVVRRYRRAGWLTINQAADLTDSSVRSLQRRLAAEGVAFSELVDEVRAELANDMLKETDLALNQIATELGYSALSNFSRAFQRWTSVTPSAFRSGQHRKST